MIYKARLVSAQSSAGSRVLALTLCLTSLALLVTAAGLSPDANGFGTHRQLHLQECAFLASTGIPCPACGMTTSFAWFAHGNLLASLYVQPMGAILAVICGMTVWAGGYMAITGKPIHRILSSIPEKIYYIPLLGLAVGGWAWKIFIHLHHVDGW